MRHYDRQGKPIDLLDWAAKFDDENYNRVAEMRFESVYPIHVSTVWLGLNHQFRDGPPLIFETTVFGGDENEYCRRYSTLHDAIRGHDEIVEKLRFGQPLTEV